MRRYIVFYADRVWGEYTEWPSSYDIPDGSYMYSVDAATKDLCVWWHNNGAWGGCVAEGVPKAVRTLVLLMT